MVEQPDVNRVFPFFVSCGRSGSTLFRSMFDSHPELAVPGESYFITELLPKVGAYHSGGSFDAGRFIEDVFTLNWTPRSDEPTWIDKWGVDKAELRRTVIAAEPATYPEAVRSVFRFYADTKGKPLYGDKTPAYVTGITGISQLLPEARFIHLVRDGRNVALAFLGAPFGPRTLEEIALHWRSRVIAGREAGRRLGPAAYMEVKYEDLVSSPPDVLRQVCDWLDLSFDEEMLDHRASVKSLGLGFDRAHQNVLRPIQKGMRDWRTQMKEADLERFELLAGDALNAFGYERGCSDPNFGTRAVVRARRFYLRGKKVSRRLRGLGSADWW